MQYLESIFAGCLIGVSLSTIAVLSKQWRHSPTARYVILMLICAIPAAFGNRPTDVTGLFSRGSIGLIAYVGTWFWVWMTLRALFSDRYYIRPYHWMTLAVGLCLTVAAIVYKDPQSAVDERILALVIVSFIIACTYTLARDAKGDLIDQRRRLRTAIIVVLTMYLGLSGAVRPWIFEMQIQSIDTINTVHLAIINMFVIAFTASLQQPDLTLLAVPNAPRQQAERPNRDKILNRLEEAMHKDKLYLRERLSIGDLAELTKQPLPEIRKCINQGLGFRNFNQYVNHFRLEEARRLLSNPDNANEKVFSIALDCGFSSLAPFNRAFKEAYGVTPSQYRDQSNAHKVG